MLHVVSCTHAWLNHRPIGQLHGSHSIPHPTPLPVHMSGRSPHMLHDVSMEHHCAANEVNSERARWLRAMAIAEREDVFPVLEALSAIDGLARLRIRLKTKTVDH